ncbi:stage II sporulation protein D [Mesobacillus subterraneus]|uniref:stage II sporulation protein D n=1 Tax=Mesobacillus subterraneus TaxID=285983 RepID=UPI0020415267|nr:stage II sporulation protein D [Mesobacillus subterraneus]MCM3576152.1 stage II sporulation protein D [Mesobacillus subterraneus]
MKAFNIMFILFFVLVLCVPSFVVLAFGNNTDIPIITPKIQTSTDKPKPTEEKTISVSVYRMNKGEVEEIDLEKYLIGVLASEMPARYGLEALKAQAISARTYSIKFLLTDNKNSVPAGADITDSTLQQVYKNQNELKDLWKNDNYAENIKKITQAVEETEGMVMTYNGELIDASFFAISNGYTENSEDYWNAALPYLRSVPSPWDTKSPDYKATKTFTYSDIELRLGVKLSDQVDIKRTSSNRVSSVNIGGKVFSGVEFRDALDLKSTDFSIKVDGDKVQITTKGYGHGVGMSQFGANSMASEGKSYKEILEYYYQGIKLENLQSNQDFKELVVKRETDNK